MADLALVGRSTARVTNAFNGLGLHFWIAAASGDAGPGEAPTLPSPRDIHSSKACRVFWLAVATPIATAFLPRCRAGETRQG